MSGITEQVAATSVRFVDDVLLVSLSDGREISLPMGRVEWLAWLAKASPQQRSKWSIEPGGFAIYMIGLKISQGLERSRTLLMAMSNAYFASE